MKRTYRATLGPPHLDVRQVEPDVKRAAKLTRVIDKHVHEPTRLHGLAPGAVDLMGVLRAVHDLYGCLPRPLVEFVARRVERYTGQVYATASFYSDIYLDPKGRHHIKVCTGTTCHIKGAGLLARACSKALGGVPAGETDESGDFTFFTTACVGTCSLAPVLMVDTDIYGNPAPDTVAKILSPYREEEEA
ncbi:MAG: NAD(P)H-dependent oxidoreductase subunit E [Leptospirillia bacterium]